MSAISFSASMEMLAGDIVALCIATSESLEFRLEVFCEVQRHE